MTDTPQKKGMSTTTIVLIVLAVIFVLGLGTCGAAALWVGAKAKEVKQSIADGGLVVVTPPEVVSELAGPKKDYVGAWTSKTGKSTLSIQPNGQLILKQDEAGHKEELTAPIAAFQGDDIDIKMIIEVKIKVAPPPHKVGNEWEMVARGITFRRPAE